jgi:homocitrate synthase NifV
MDFKIEEKKEITIIDRSLPEIFKINKDVKRLELIYFCWVLDNIGITYIEIDKNVLAKMRKLPAGIDFIYRVENENDLEICKKNGLSSIILKKGTTGIINIDSIKDKNFDITLEIDVENIDDIFEEIKGEKFLIYKSIINKVRLTGLSKIKDLNWYKKIYEFGDMCNVEIDICPRNKYYMATTLAVEAVMAGMETITMSFLGIGDNGGFAPIEEVLVSVKLLVKGDFGISLNCFQDLSQSYEKLTKTKIPDDKAVVGTKIFNYESGIHANGIQKVSLTYEPFEPQMVGLKRDLKIGKHSGTASIMRKLKELGLSCNKGTEAQMILEGVRNKSMELRRNLEDDELIELYIEKCF